MKLIKFLGKNVRGYLNLNINFREGTTFLIGINGSGKTSVFKLINGLLSPSYKILEDIEYQVPKIKKLFRLNMCILKDHC